MITAKERKELRDNFQRMKDACQRGIDAKTYAEFCQALSDTCGPQAVISCIVYPDQ